MSYIMNQEGNKIVPAECFVIEINSKNEIIVYLTEEAVLEDPSYMVIGRYETKKRAEAVFKCLLNELAKTNYYYMP